MVAIIRTGDMVWVGGGRGRIDHGLSRHFRVHLGHRGGVRIGHNREEGVRQLIVGMNDICVRNLIGAYSLTLRRLHSGYEVK